MKIKNNSWTADWIYLICYGWDWYIKYLNAGWQLIGFNDIIEIQWNEVKFHLFWFYYHRDVIENWKYSTFEYINIDNFVKIEEFYLNDYIDSIKNNNVFVSKEQIKDELSSAGYSINNVNII